MPLSKNHRLTPFPEAPMNHMDVGGMMSMPSNEGSPTPTVQEHIDQRNQQGEIKKMDYQQQLLDDMTTA